jgi:transcriptional regulator with XRE-family HTH domain
MKATENVPMKDITSGQLRAARALLGWNLERLSAACGLPVRTLGRFEREETTPRASTLSAIRAALEAAGVEFIAENGGGAGVRLRVRG